MFKFDEDFLKDRSIRVRVGAAMSSTYFLECNTSGQCAEPTAVHHHDHRLARIVNELFPDFCSMWKSGPCLSALSIDIQRYPAETAKFFEEWGFKISIDRAVEILFSRSKHILTAEVILKINDVTIKFFEKTVKFLGVIFDQGLTWAADIDNTFDR